MTIVGAEDAPEGMMWVPTSRGPWGQLEDWKLVPRDVVAEWDVRRWSTLR